MMKTPKAPLTSSPAQALSSERAAWLYVALMLMILLTPPLAQALLDWHRDGRPTALELFTTVPDRESLRALETRLDKQLWIGELGRRAWTPRVDKALERGSAKVVYGHGKWLFYRPALRFVAGSGFSDHAHRPRHGGGRADRVHHAITDFNRQLRERGKRLLFVPVPTKATVYPERVSKRARGLDAGGTVNDPAVRPLLESLRASGVEVIDPLPVLLAAKTEGAEVFLPADSHWSWAGMLRVARHVALAIAPPRAKDRGPVFDARRVRYEADGDLYTMLGYGKNPAAPRPRPSMSYEAWQVAGTREGQQPVHEASKILVIGDSSTLVFSESSLGLGRGAGFAERLAYALDQPVDLLASPAAGTRQLQSLLNVERQRLDAADVVVWVMTQRSFRFTDDVWQPIQLPRRDAAAPTDAIEQPLISGRISARVLVLSEAPVRADYADCLMIVRYQLLDDPSRSFDVAHVGWQNYSATRAAGLVVGDIVDLEISKLPAEQSLDRVCWVDDIGLHETPLWATSYGVR